MIKAIIIDDEEDARFLLRNQLEQDYKSSITVLGEADDVDTGIEAIKKFQPDVVFLDIQMPQGTGFDLLEQLDEVNFEVVFVTAFNDYALKAFEFSAFGYLMKPLKSKDLDVVISKLKDHLEMLEKGSEKRLKVLVENYGDDKKIKKLVVSNIKGFKVLELEEIYQLEGDRNYTHFILQDGKKITASKTLGEYDSLLTDFGFFRIHKSIMVNLRHVKEFLHEGDGMVVMKNDKALKVSRNRRQEFMKRFL